MAEETIFQDDSIHITTSRAILREKTYAMANVTSVSMFTSPAQRGAGIVMIVLGAFMLAAGGLAGTDLQCVWWFGVIMLGVGAIAAFTPKDSYSVRIGSASGETNALHSHDAHYIQRVVAAMNEAIIRRG